MCFHETNIAEIFFFNNIYCNDFKFVGTNKTKNKESTIFSASKSLQHIRIQMTSISPENTLRVQNSRKKKTTSYSSRFLLLGTYQKLDSCLFPPGTRPISSLHLALKGVRRRSSSFWIAGRHFRIRLGHRERLTFKIDS